jgi:hypothetical protein
LGEVTRTSWWTFLRRFVLVHLFLRFAAAIRVSVGK